MRDLSGSESLSPWAGLRVVGVFLLGRRGILQIRLEGGEDVDEEMEKR